MNLSLLAYVGVVPAIHFISTDGLRRLVDENSFYALLVMAMLYLIGATLYATRTPERFFPGKCDIIVSVSILTYYLLSLAPDFSVPLASTLPRVRGVRRIRALLRHLGDGDETTERLVRLRAHRVVGGRVQRDHATTLRTLRKRDAERRADA